MKQYEEKAKKWLSEIKENQSKLTLSEIYDLALLTEIEKKEIDKYKDILAPKLFDNANSWLASSYEIRKHNHIKKIAGILVKCSNGNLVGDIRCFLKIMFSDAMDYSYRLKSDGFTLGPKSNQFFDIFFELILIDFFLERNYKIDLAKTKLSNGKKAEFWIEDTTLGTYIEAKNVNSDKLDHIIYSKEFRKTEAMGVFFP